MDKFVDKNNRPFTIGCKFIKDVKGKQKTYSVYKLCATENHIGVKRVIHCVEVATADNKWSRPTHITSFSNTIIVDEQ